ncbi:22055_t:CDS:1 [Dentiscutata erythropus]|uniref:22055_t:CDS:1 n=1 Tax=Dentiscutata erythropus TaxID=1348616 RepID=A0A9N8WDH6_9GLOM|nr:22055_t:CDS:1 [Dentiscutata erythropus]
MSNKNADEHYKLLKLGREKYTAEDYKGAVCCLTSCSISKNNQIKNEAKLLLAMIYIKENLFFGKDIKDKTIQAFQYFNEVFQSNSEFSKKARDMLIICYQDGIGVERDDSKAAELYKEKHKKIKKI